MQRVGQQAVKLGLETLDMTRIHAATLAELKIADSPIDVLKRAEVFFTATIAAIERTHLAAFKADGRLNQLKKKLGRRTLALDASNRSLARGIKVRKSLEKTLEKSGRRSKQLLKESLALQKHLRALTHGILAAQENKRKKIGSDLQDEIAQTLLGINVRLLTLRKEVATNVKDFKKDIASTRRLVDSSLKSIKRFAREFGKHHE
jgi:signal transduction histidine kinase